MARIYMELPFDYFDGPLLMSYWDGQARQCTSALSAIARAMVTPSPNLLMQATPLLCQHQELQDQQDKI